MYVLIQYEILVSFEGALVHHLVGWGTSNLFDYNIIVLGCIDSRFN